MRHWDWADPAVQLRAYPALRLAIFFWNATSLTRDRLYIRLNEPEGEAFRFNRTYNGRAVRVFVSRQLKLLRDCEFDGRPRQMGQPVQWFPRLRTIGKAQQEIHKLNRTVTSWQKWNSRRYLRGPE